MKKFEYLLIENNLSNYQLNVYGKNGWELVSDNGFRYIFKREITQNGKAD